MISKKKKRKNPLNDSTIKFVKDLRFPALKKRVLKNLEVISDYTKSIVKELEKEIFRSDAEDVIIITDGKILNTIDRELSKVISNIRD